ncbi:hypothetical protein GCM10009565_73740 [Amycolatopsis albidoflavus]
MLDPACRCNGSEATFQRAGSDGGSAGGAIADLGLCGCRFESEPDGALWLPESRTVDVLVGLAP